MDAGEVCYCLTTSHRPDSTLVLWVGPVQGGDGEESQMSSLIVPDFHEGQKVQSVGCTGYPSLISSCSFVKMTQRYLSLGPRPWEGEGRVFSDEGWPWHYYCCSQY